MTAAVDPRVPDLQRIRAALGALRTGGVPLPGALTAEYSKLLGLDLSDVRVHQGGAASEAASRLGATAFTHGTNIAVGEQLDLDSAFGRHVLAHELVHVAQFKRGGGAEVAARMEIGPSGSAIEIEAERGAQALTRGQTFEVGSHARMPGISLYGPGDQDPNTCAPVDVPGANPPPGQSTQPATPGAPTPPANYTPATPPPAPPPAPAPGPAPAPTPGPQAQPGGPATPAPAPGMTPGGGGHRPGGGGGAHPGPAPAPGPGGGPGPQPQPVPMPPGDLDARVQEELEKRADPKLKTDYSKAVAGV